MHDERIADIIPSIQKLLDALACRNVFVCDNHPPHTREFETFPKHCVIGSEEAEVVDELKPYVKSWISKNSTNTFHAQAFQEFLQEDLDYYQDIVVVGCCTDLCVLHFVLTLQTWLNEHNIALLFRKIVRKRTIFLRFIQHLSGTKWLGI